MFPRGRTWAIAALTLFTGCKKEGGAEKKKPEAAAAADKDACPAPGDPKLEKTGALAWFHDDLEGAVRCATARKVPIVIDEWAPWCHTCLSMQTAVFPDPAFAPLVDRFVWLSADTDKDVNATIVASYPPAAWPTFFVIAPNGTIHGRFVGSASVTQFREFLTESEKSFLAGAAPPSGPMADVVAANRILVDADALARTDPRRADALRTALGKYQHALATAPAEWPRRPDVLVATMDTLGDLGDPKACLDFALAHMDETGNAASASDFLFNARRCVAGLEPQDPAALEAFRRRALARVTALIDDATAPLSADDRSDAMVNVRELQDELGMAKEAVATAERQRALLDDAAAKAPDPFAAMTYNWPRSEVYAYLHEHLELVPALEKSAADLPREYDPPYRLAWIYKEAGKVDDALPWARKAVALAYGPRKARVQSLLADLLRAKGDTAGELEARRALVATYRSLPPAQARPEDLAKAETDLAALEAVAKPATN